MVNFKLEKLKLQIYSDRLRTGSPQDTFEVMFNPASYSLRYQNVYQSPYQGINTSGREAKYSLSKPSQLSLELLIDDSGTVPVSDLSDLTDEIFSGSGLVSTIGGEKDVYKQVQRFLQLTTYMDGDIHEPKFLILEWGDLSFNCRLASVTVAYTLFNRSGQPIRAKLATEFIEDVETSKRLKQENKTSPDLTHQRVVKAEETLPLIANRIYGDPTYYMQLAKANKLNNFRKLRAGSTVQFPPIKQPIKQSQRSPRSTEPQARSRG